MRLTFISLCLLNLSVAVSAVPARFGRKPSPVVDRALIDDGSLDSNAKRFAAGLPPLPARKLWSPTASAKRWSTSPVPHMGRVGITSKNGTNLGFISKLSLKDQTSKSINATFFGALIPRNYTLIQANSTLNTSSPGIWRRDGLAQNVTDHVTLAGVAQTAPDSIPQVIPNTVQQSTNSTGTPTGGSGNTTSAGSAMDGESAIWSFDPTTGIWQVIWINYDGTAVPTQPFYNPSSSSNSSSIQMASDTNTYQQANPDAVEITLSFVT
ncbi:hypothetical protein DL93DRAFT_194931 [Clavulina sp. PMI_390]|nr:hypothetical protein DL93DRAFT_194931 [Clavulina sp. PMI_390]